MNQFEGNESLEAKDLQLHKNQDDFKQKKVSGNIETIDVEEPYQEPYKQKVINYAQNKGTQLIQSSISAVKLFPSILTWGATGFKKILSNQISKYHPQPDQHSQPSSSIVDSEPIILIMPEKIIAAGLQAQNEWIEQHSNDPNIEIYIPKKIDLKLKNINQSSNSSNPDPEPECDVDILPEYSNFKDPWSKIINLDDSQFMLVSQEDFKELTHILRNSQDIRKEIEDLKIKEQKVEDEKLKQLEEQTEKLKKIKLYPYLSPMIKREQVQAEIEQAERLRQQDFEEKRQLKLKNEQEQEKQLKEAFEKTEKQGQQTQFVKLKKEEYVEINKQLQEELLEEY